jgi:16S rRNA (cytidine1402-2'-O)-methyltransferase
MSSPSTGLRACLFIVATPIGNLEDITLRAIRILSEVDLIAAEDTRQTKILLRKYDINTPLTSYHKFNIKSKTSRLIELLRQGQNIALVSDSGTPTISDPGYELVNSAIKAGINVEPIPGPSAVVSALVVSGLPTDSFIFEGFLPKKPGKKKKVLESLKEQARTIIIYESPYRLIKTLINIRDIFGDREVAVCREMTKKFEEIIRGKAGDVLERLADKKIRGEIVLVISGQVTQRERK